MDDLVVSSSSSNKAVDIKGDLGSPLSSEEQSTVEGRHVADLSSVVYASHSHQYFPAKQYSCLFRYNP